MDVQDCYYVTCTFPVLASLYYTLYLLKPGMNQKVYMNQLMNYIYRAAVLEFSWDNGTRNWTDGKVINIQLYTKKHTPLRMVSSILN